MDARSRCDVSSQDSVDRCAFCGKEAHVGFAVDWSNPVAPPIITKPRKICLYCLVDGKWAELDDEEN